MTRKRWTVGVAVVVVLAVVATVALLVVRRPGDDKTGVAYAVTLAPPGSQRLLWTDWAGVRAEVDLDLGADATAAQVEELLDRGFDTDLTSTSALLTSAVAMQESLGFSPATLDWELFAQSTSSATLVMRLGGGVTADDVRESLRTQGYTEPADDDGTWTREAATTPIATEVTPILGFIAFDGDLVIASDRSTGIDEASASVDDAASEPVPAGVVDALGSPLTAAVYSGAEACSALAMAGADPADEAEGEALVERAGPVNPVTGFAIGAGADDDVRVVLGFETDEQARTNADTRAVLAAGPAPGQGGDFTDRFTIEQVRADASVVTFDLAPVEGESVVSDLSSGPVLFATC